MLLSQIVAILCLVLVLSVAAYFHGIFKQISKDTKMLSDIVKIATGNNIRIIPRIKRKYTRKKKPPEQV